MNKFKKILLVLVLSLALTGCGEKKETKKKEVEPCVSITGGAYVIIFETNDENPIENMSVCIACAPDTYQDLPVLESEGKEFDGWYYDKALTKKVEVTSSGEIEPSPKYDDKDNTCIVGYNNMTLYAKWNENA